MVDPNVKYEDLMTPEEIKSEVKLPFKISQNISKFRKEVIDILSGKDNRKIIIVGPCSIHNFEETLEYVDNLKKISDKYHDKILIVVRAYLEKPRSTIGWKGFINDPYLDGSNNINDGLKLSRKLLFSITEKGFPIATEFLDVLVYPYIEDLISIGAIGARTTESQTHRQMVSGLSIPIGFKNATSGNIDVSMNAMIASKNPHSFIGINDSGNVSKVTTKGNPDCFLVLRGGDAGPNYEEEFVKEAQDRLIENNLSPKILIDCSHGNSMKDYKNQKIVFRDVITQMNKNPNLFGIMLESYIQEGSQKIDLKNLKKGVSVTDSCISINETEKLIKEAYDVLVNGKS